MKTIAYITHCILLSLFLAACNSDVFVESFEPSVSELELDGNGDEATIRFKSDNWNVLRVYDVHYNYYEDYNVYDEHGTLIEKKTKHPQLNGLGKIVCVDEKMRFTVQRTKPDEVKVIVDANERHYYSSFQIVACNEYEREFINVTVSSAGPYKLDHITYSLDTFSYEEQMGVVRRLTVNSGSGIVAWTFHPYKNEAHRVQFKYDEDDYYELDAAGMTFEIPSLENGVLKMEGVKAEYARGVQSLPLPFSDDVEVEVSISPWANETISLWLRYDWFETEYAAHAVNVVTGKKRIFKGKLESRMPVSHYITREEIKDSDEEKKSHVNE